MRKNRKRELLEVVKTLQSAGETIQKKMRTTPVDKLVEILARCQQSAVAVGESIEQELGLGTVTVNLLEEYCELLYQIADSLVDVKNTEKLLKKTAKLLYKVENSIKYDIPESKREVVFLPYKASMWDCMESVWMAAQEDENCECYVIPIPYYDRDRDGSLGQLHYEGNQYPDYVTITALDEYNIPERKPDVIYIHNPFEDCNYVTSVHPMFYARELRKHTERLVYIPYFFTEGELPKSHLQLPAYPYMDIMVVQNASVKEQLKGLVDAEKIAVLGSPKLDRILGYEAKQCMPQPLKEYVGNKKVVLLNTSISFLLENANAAVEKIKSVVQIVKDREDVVLVWRPHPLLEATLQSMRPGVYREYMLLKEQFVQERMGVLDTGMDLAMLVACADAYIGEATSSMVVLFKSLGKPIFILASENQEVATEKAEAFFDFYLEENKIYFAHSDFNAVCVGNMETGVVDNVITAEETVCVPRSYTDVCERNGELFFAPMNADALMRVGITSGECSTTKLETPAASNFNRVLKYKQYLYFVPTIYDAILRYDCENHTVKAYDEPVMMLKKHSRETGYISMFASCIVEDKLYFATPTSNYVAEFDLETEKTQIYEVGSKDNGYWDMLYDGKDFWLNPYKGIALVRWNKERNEVREYDEYPEGFSYPEEGKDCFIRIVDCGATLLAFPKSANMIIELDKETGKLRPFELGLHYEEGTRKDAAYSWPSNYYFAKREGDKVYALSAYDHSLLKIDYVTHTYRAHKFVLPEEFVKDLAKNLFWQDRAWVQANYIYRETCHGKIQDFIEALVQSRVGYSEEERQAFYQNVVNPDGTAGKKVHQYVMEK